MLSGQAESECGLLPSALLEVASHRVSLTRRTLHFSLSQEMLEPLTIPDRCASLGFSRLQIITEFLTPISG